MIADASGRATGFALAPGQAHELPLAPLLLTLLSAIPAWIVADRGYASHAFRDLIRQLGARPAIPAKRNEAPVACPGARAKPVARPEASAITQALVR